ncbi:MAG: hypothetical protein HOI34_13605 [Rhodospirillaceae bacterium]|nr:hypothetical protein [Rhodospirillaceae bacterium]MBT6512381.1 hypothetical protein [Rhodospirillaceae bacterium]MBT7646942.1 hypothetical protein [Rhodospirillaceae bacterium]
MERLIGAECRVDRLQFSAVLGYAPCWPTGLLALRYFANGFRSAKLKLGPDAGRNCANLLALTPFPRVRVDANNLWADAASAYRGLVGFHDRIDAIEEPVAPGDLAAAFRLSEALERPIILDESLYSRRQLDALSVCPERWIVNLRVSKLGGLIRALEVAGAAQAAGIEVIVGAQIGETSVLTRAALALHAGLDQPAVEQEGAFGTRLLGTDLVDRPLMFADGGWIDTAKLPELQRPGLGLAVRADRLEPS